MVTAVFLALAGLLAAVATGIVLMPLLRDGKRAAWGALAAAAVVATVGLYLWLGTPLALQSRVTAPPKTLEEAIEQLQAVLGKQPGNVDNWVILAQYQQQLGRADEAAASLEHAVQLAPNEPDLLVDAAQARVQAQANAQAKSNANTPPQMMIDDTGLQWLQKARELAPDNQNATLLIGAAQFQRGQAETAAHTWESLLPKLDPATAAELVKQINVARNQAGLPPFTAPTASAAAGNHDITVQVTLAPALQARAAAGTDTLFVIARVPGGPPMPVAVERHPAQTGPLTVTLNDADGPMPTQKLSMLGEVEVFARLSASGMAMRQDGDVESTPVKVTLPTDKTLNITLGQP